MSGAALLNADFVPSTDEAWRALVAKTLKGGAFETLVTRTADGIEVQPLYAGASGAAAPARSLPQMDRAWDLRAAIFHPDPVAANIEALAELAGGAQSIRLTLDPTGAAGTAVGGVADLARVLDGIFLDVAPVALDAGLLGPLAADWLAELAGAVLGAPLAFHLDPLSAFAVTGVTPGPLEAHIETAAVTAARLAGDFPAANLFLASGAFAHEAGGSEVQEVAAAAAAALVYVRALLDAGLPAETALPRITLGLTADADVFLTIAKLRAARAVWARLSAACGAPCAALIEVRSSRRMLARRGPWVNMLRLAAAGFGAAVGGADAVVMDPFTQPLGHPTAFARRQSRNSQLILMEEAGLGRVADPAAGSGYVEALTEQIARRAWAMLQAIEARGGLIAALQDGYVADAIDRVRAAGPSDPVLIGVTRHPDPDEAAVAVEVVDPTAFVRLAPDVRRPGPDSRCPPLPPVRLAEPFEAGGAAA